MSKKQHAFSRRTEQALALFGAHIHHARKKHHMTVQELAERLGVSRNTVQEMERGQGRVAIGGYFEAATILGIDLFQSDTLPIALQQDYLHAQTALLPKTIHRKSVEVKDDF